MPKNLLNKLLLSLSVLIVGLTGCATEPNLNPMGTLEVPLGLEAAANVNGKGILLTFYASNNEDDFDGFNVHISERGNVAEDTVAGGTALLPDGITPTIKSNRSDFDTNKKREYLVLYRNNELAPLAKGTKYFFILRAHSSSGNASAASNEASAIAP